MTLQIGRRLGRLVVVRRAGKIGRLRYCSVCVCDCGTESVAANYDLLHGHTTSCGCWRADNKRTHGKTSTPTYICWRSMMQRCYDSGREDFINYGGRGITVCRQWHSFKNFLADMGERPSGLTLERIKNDVGYNKRNCMWATREQQNNNKRNIIRLNYHGSKITIDYAAAISGLKPNTIKMRVWRGWSHDLAVDTPLFPR